MDREKPDKKSTDVVPVTPDSSLHTWRRPNLFEHDIDAIFDDFRKSFDVMMRPYFPFEFRVQEQGMLPVRYVPLDIVDDGDHYIIHAELPGFTKDQVDVQVNNDGLSIKAQGTEK